MQNGDEAALTNLYFKYKDKLFSFCLKLTGSEDFSHEIVYSTFYHLWQERLTLDDNFSVDRFLFDKARRGILNYHSEQEALNRNVPQLVPEESDWREQERNHIDQTGETAA